MTELNIFTDYQTMITSVTSSRLYRSHQETIDQSIANISALASKKIVTTIHWVPGHPGLAANELANRYAKEVAAKAMELFSFFDFCQSVFVQ